MACSIIMIKKYIKFSHTDYRGAMGIMLVYDITNEKSFENIIKWLRNIDEHANEDVERMILGNKCDMSDKRIVNKERGEAVSQNLLFLSNLILMMSLLVVDCS